MEHIRAFFIGGVAGFFLTRECNINEWKFWAYFLPFVVVLCIINHIVEAKHGD